MRHLQLVVDHQPAPTEFPPTWPSSRRRGAVLRAPRGGHRPPRPRGADPVRGAGKGPVSTAVRTSAAPPGAGRDAPGDRGRLPRHPAPQRRRRRAALAAGAARPGRVPVPARAPRAARRPRRAGRRLLARLQPPAARNCLNTALSILRGGLRDVLGDLPVVVHRDGAYALEPGLDLTVDAEEFESGADEGTRRRRAGDAEAAARAYRGAAALYAGDLFEDDPYEDWMASRRRYLRETYLTAARRPRRLRGGPRRSVGGDRPLPPGAAHRARARGRAPAPDDDLRPRRPAGPGAAPVRPLLRGAAAPAARRAEPGDGRPARADPAGRRVSRMARVVRTDEASARRSGRPAPPAGDRAGSTAATRSAACARWPATAAWASARP